MKVSYLEVYNENVYDLLVDPSQRVPLKLAADKGGKVEPRGVTTLQINSAAEGWW